MKKMILSAFVLAPIFAFASDDQPIERKSVKANVTIIQDCSSPMMMSGNRMQQCLREKKKEDRKDLRRLRNSIKARSYKGVHNYVGSRERNQGILNGTTKKYLVDETKPLRTVSKAGSRYVKPLSLSTGKRQKSIFRGSR